MNVRLRPLVDRFSASSDFDEKLVASRSPRPPSPLDPSGTRSVLIRCPDGVISSRKTGDVIPKLASARSLFHTWGYVPSLVAVAHPDVQPGGRTVTPGCSSPGVPV